MTAEKAENKPVYQKQEALRKALMRLPEWFRENKRELPWRGSGNPYDVWISEIMLQQTRVAAAKEYFLRFRAELPGVKELAAVPEERLLKLWQGLGYYSRSRNLKRAAQIILRDFGGRIPSDPDLLRKLPGIGSYTAGAIASIAYGVPEPAVDGNVLRVCSRISGNSDDIALPATKRSLENALRNLMQEVCTSPSGDEESKLDPPSPNPGDFNQAIMELGALICVPNGEPLCGKCPVRELCYAKSEGCIGRLPVKSGKKQRRLENRTVLLIQNGDRYLIRKRPDKGLLARLWEFPAADGFLASDEAVRAAGSILGREAEPLYIERLPDSRHIFSHVEWRMHAYRIRIADPKDEVQTVFDRETLRFALPGEMKERYPLPSAFAAYRDPILEQADEKNQSNP
jgi:A/G-specific adenine glycosylase